MQLPRSINYSYWELKAYFEVFDLLVVGAGIVGLSSAISFKERHKKAKILVVERGVLPSGASTKNAGFACFGSVSELLDDQDNIEEETVWRTVKMRWTGLSMLRKRLGDKNLGFKPWGGYELFDDPTDYLKCLDKSSMLNKGMKDTLGLNNCYTASKKTKQFKGVCGAFFNPYEGQIDTGMMMKNLALLAAQNDITILNNVSISAIQDQGQVVELESTVGLLKARKVIVATNGFAKELLDIKDLEPARAQVLITKPIFNLKIQGTFHYQKGYYYFRNINNRVLLGGGRNLDFKTETTTRAELNMDIQKHLELLLKTMILPNTSFEIESRWSGIMGVGSEKEPIIKLTSPNVLAAVRMGGMGIAIGSWVGENAATTIS